VSPLLVETTWTAATEAVVLVPVQNPEPPPGRGEEFGKASPVALVVIILLGVVTVFLIRGMTKRIRRLPATFDKQETPQGSGREAADRDGEDAGPDAS
jgi:hypothetical protein